MILASIERRDSTDQGSFGTLSIEAQLKSWPSLELPWRNNVRGFSCIKADTYLARLVDSPKFNRKVYRLENKNDRGDVEIHIVNFAGDTTQGWKSQEHGCIGLGLKVGELDNGEGRQQKAILSSAAALDQLIAATGGDDVTLTIKWAEGFEPADLVPDDAHTIARPGLAGTP